MCVFGRSRKVEMLSRTRWYKNCYNLSSLQFFNSKLGRMLCNSYSNRFCDFFIFPIFGIGAINFQSKKTDNPPLFQCVFFSPKEVEKLFDFDFHKLHNMTNVCAKFGFRLWKVFHPEPFWNNALPTQAPSWKPYQRSSIRQLPRIYCGPPVNYLKSKMQSAQIFASSNVEEWRNHSVTFSVSKTDFTCRLRQRRSKHNPCW